MTSQETSLTNQLQAIALTGNITLLLPTNTAFQVYFDETGSSLAELIMQDQGAYARNLLYYHILPSSCETPTTLSGTDSRFLTMASGNPIYVSKDFKGNSQFSDMLGRTGGYESYNDVNNSCVFAASRCGPLAL